MGEVNGDGGDLHCGLCRWWRRNEATAESLGQPAVGECRWGPPSATSHLVQTAQGQRQLVLAAYPQMVAQFPACGRYEARKVEVAT